MQIHVVIPCYRVNRQILGVLASIGTEVSAVFVVDDGCPENCADYVTTHCTDTRVTVLRHIHNQGVGAAMVTGMRAAICAGAEVIVKIDGDGQMDPALIEKFVAPIRTTRADFTKGNRFYQLRYLRGMPVSRIIGNAGLSFLSKLSSGYWSIMDPTNGYIAIHASVARALPLDQLAKRYFFESDLLFQLNLLRAVIEDIPMSAVYRDEKSHLSIFRTLIQFSYLHTARLLKRVFYNYYLRDFNIASLMLLLALPLLMFGIIFGATEWNNSITTGMTVSSGTVMLAALPAILGLQLLLTALQYDMSQQPRIPIHDKL
nr:glycosyltransferase family 2 protein [Rhodoferax sp.]